MNTLDVLMRVRPPRVALVINKRSPLRSLLEAITFSSRLWGGAYHWIVPANSTQSSPDAEALLTAYRPDYVFGKDVDDHYWASIAERVCQPRSYMRLTSELARRPSEAYVLDLPHVFFPLAHLRREQHIHADKCRVLVAREFKHESLVSACGAALFGNSDPVAEKFVEGTFSSFASESTFADLVLQHAQDIRRNRMPWIECTMLKLTSFCPNAFGSEPTVVVVRKPIEDLALFWNLRSRYGATRDIIPVPAFQLQRPDVIRAIGEWLEAIRERRSNSNYVNLVSAGMKANEGIALSRRLLSQLRRFKIRFVDFAASREITSPIFYHSQHTQDVRTEAGRVTFKPPEPEDFSEAGAPRSWFVDIAGEVGSRRSFKELRLPRRTAMNRLLNLPSPPTLGTYSLPRVGEGPDCINVRCWSSDKLFDISIPSDEEVVCSLLRDASVIPSFDEKRNLYEPAIQRFNSLDACANALSGKSGEILRYLSRQPRMYSEILRECRLGEGVITDTVKWIEPMLDRFSPTEADIVRKRFASQSTETGHGDGSVRGFLDMWQRQGVLDIYAKLGPCATCGRHSFVSELRLSESASCSNCGAVIPSSPSVFMAYRVKENVALALGQGLTTVAQTGRLLKELTSRGFQWVPGIKYAFGEKHGDIDIAASCDGHLVLCECKSIPNNERQARAEWDKSHRQISDLIDVAAACRASLVVLAVNVDAIPRDVIESLTAKAWSGLALCFLTKSTLETGHMRLLIGDQSGPASIGDLISQSHPPLRQVLYGGTRKLRSGGAELQRVGNKLPYASPTASRVRRAKIGNSARTVRSRRQTPLV